MGEDVIIVGAGIVGSAIAYGLLKSGAKVLVLDGDDRDFRAARANFGLVWVQGKGHNFPAYSRLTRQSADLWPGFLNELVSTSGIKVDYSKPGGLMFALGEPELTKREALVAAMHNLGVGQDTEVIDRSELVRLLPRVRLGQDVSGASFCPHDSHVNPLQLLAALHRAIGVLGGRILWRNQVTSISAAPGGGFEVHGDARSWGASQVVVTAGLNTTQLLAPLDMDIPLRAQRGQILVTERLDPILPYPASGLRQTSDGTVMIGATHEDVGRDSGVTTAAAITLARRAVRIAPELGRVRLVRQWSGLRVLTRDGAPIYEESPIHRGLFAVTSHSGVTLAAANAALVAPALVAGGLPEAVSPFSNGRFDVSQCA